MPDLRTTIRAAIEAAGISQAEAARRSGINASNLSLYLRGKGELRSDSIERLIAALGVKVKAPRAR